MSTVRILIVEDEVLIAEYLKDTLSSLEFGQVRLAHTKQQALTEIDQFKPQVILLDIRMEEELEGISLAEHIQGNQKTPFIFITAHADRDIVQQALRTKPAAYITKPFKKTDVYAAISIVVKNLEDDQEKEFIFKDGYSMVRLLCSDILYIEGEGNYIHIVTEGKKHTIRKSLEWCLEHLPNHCFVRIHRSFIVNSERIERSNAHHVFVKGVSIPISRGKRITLPHTVLKSEKNL